MTKKEFIHKFGETLPTGIDMPENHIKIAFMWYKMGYKLAVDEAKQWLCSDCIRRCACQLPKEECGRLMGFLKVMEE